MKISLKRRKKERRKATSAEIVLLRVFLPAILLTMLLCLIGIIGSF